MDSNLPCQVTFQMKSGQPGNGENMLDLDLEISWSPLPVAIHVCLAGTQNMGVG